MTDNSQHDAAFAAFADEQIAPLLATMHIARAAANRKLIIGVLIGGGIGFVISATLFLGKVDVPSLLLLGFILGGAIFGAMPGGIAHVSASKNFADEHISKIAEFLGLSFKTDSFIPPHFSLFRQAGLLPSSDRETFTALVSGTRNNAKFVFYDAHLQEWQTRTTGKTTRRELVTVFRGQLLHSPYPRKFTSRTLITRDMGWFNGLSGLGLGKGMKRVGLSDPVFEKIFEVYSTDQVESRYLVDPLFMERLKAMEGQQKKRTPSAAFLDGALLVTLKGKGKYLPSISGRDVDARTFAVKTKNRFERLFSLLDSLMHHH